MKMMQKGENKWKYLCSCKNCTHVQYVKDEIRDGLYCVMMLQGKRTIHADDDFRVRCDQYNPKERKVDDV